MLYDLSLKLTMETLDVLIVEVSWDSVNSLDRHRAKCAFAVAVLQ